VTDGDLTLYDARCQGTYTRSPTGTVSTHQNAQPEAALLNVPGSVLIVTINDSHSSRIIITNDLKRPTQVINQDYFVINYIHLYMVLLLMGFTMPNMLPYLR
jgi:hypothetical protein